MLKRLKEEALVKCGSYSQFTGYVREHELCEEVVDKLIKEHQEDFLCLYVQYQRLNDRQIMTILSSPPGKVLIMVLKNHVLNPEAQAKLISLNNVMLLEAYLLPQGFFDAARRFEPQAERQYIKSMMQNEKLVGIELFKTYAHNTFRNIMTRELMDDLMVKDCMVTRYLLKKSFMRSDLEQHMIKNAPQPLLEMVVRERGLLFENSQIILIDRDFELAKEHFETRRFRPKAIKYYHEVRKLRVEEKFT